METYGREYSQRPRRKLRLLAEILRKTHVMQTEEYQRTWITLGGPSGIDEFSKGAIPLLKS